MMAMTLAFDVYGTLIDPHGLQKPLCDQYGDLGLNISKVWREKQLEYSFRRGLMQRYINFDVCTQQALSYACALNGVSLNAEFAAYLLDAYRQLPAFDDVYGALEQLKAEGHTLFAFSNGLSSSVGSLLQHANLTQFMTGIISVGAVETYKPSPLVYQYLLSQTQSSKASTCLVSSNPFDVLGGVNSGLLTAWVQRVKEIPFDPWGIEPNWVMHTLQDLPKILAGLEYRE